MTKKTKEKIQRLALALPSQDRQELAEALWQSLEAEPAPLPDWQRQLLDDRLVELDRNPEEGTPWEEVKAKIWPGTA